MFTFPVAGVDAAAEANVEDFACCCCCFATSKNDGVVVEAVDGTNGDEEDEEDGNALPNVGILFPNIGCCWNDLLAAVSPVAALEIAALVAALVAAAGAAKMDGLLVCLGFKNTFVFIAFAKAALSSSLGRGVTSMPRVRAQ
jgi:hypothetical protein